MKLLKDTNILSEQIIKQADAICFTSNGRVLDGKLCRRAMLRVLNGRWKHHHNYRIEHYETKN